MILALVLKVNKSVWRIRICNHMGSYLLQQIYSVTYRWFWYCYSGISPQDFDNQTLAVLRGRLVRYLMRSREVRIKNKPYVYRTIFLVMAVCSRWVENWVVNSKRHKCRLGLLYMGWRENFEFTWNFRYQGMFIHKFQELIFCICSQHCFIHQEAGECMQNK